MKIVINPEFSLYKTFIESLPSIFEQEGTSIYKARNEIKIFDVNGTILNVKSYKIPIFINRIAYTFFRPTKARRAYEYALRLISMGFLSPTPIAYIEEKKGGLLTHSYFISLHTPMQGNLRVFNDCLPLEGEKEKLAIAFGKFSAELHNKKVFHKDYSPGNVLWEKIGDDCYHFSLIDINRMQFREVGKEEGCENFCRMWAHDDFFRIVAKMYAEGRGYDVEECTDLFLRYKQKDRIHRKKRENRKAKIQEWKAKLGLN